MLKLLLLFSFSLLLQADVYDDFSKHLKDKNYESACQVGKKIFFNQERDEKFLALIGQACLKADYIDTLAMIQSRLRESESARKNSALFSSIVLQKRLIYQFMYDSTDISTLALPISNHPLSHAFIAIRDKTYSLISKDPKVIEFFKEDRKYKLYIDPDKNGKVTIEIKDRDNKISIHRYL
ncbi:MAG: hypothetical protein U9P71_05490 [Campylobacterota bacterium]|nr:hypothetical protein [Campylobacterota bacterium]